MGQDLARWCHEETQRLNESKVQRAKSFAQWLVNYGSDDFVLREAARSFLDDMNVGLRP